MSDQRSGAQGQTIEELQARIAELEAENTRLASQPEDTKPLPTVGKQRWRPIVAVVLIVLATLLTPVATIAGWSRIALTNTDAFVRVYAPLAKDPQVQQYIVEQVVGAIEANVDIDQVIGDLAEGLADTMPNRPRAQQAILLLQQPAAEGVRSMIRDATTAFVASDAFAQVWEAVLRQTHSTAIATLQGDPESLLVVQADGLGLQLGPIVAEVKQYLTSQGVGIADLIPAVDKTVVIAQADSLPTIQQGYRLTVTLGSWLAIVVVAMFIAGVLVAKRRGLATIGAAIGLGVGAAIVLGGLAAGSVIAHASVPLTVMPPGVLDVFYDTVGDTMGDLATGALVLAIVVGIVAWVAGPFRSAITLRTAYTGMLDELKDKAAARGVSTGKFGAWMYVHRVGIRLTIGGLALLYLLLNRPLVPGKVFTTVFVALLAVLLLSLLHRKPSPAETASPATA